MVIVTLIRRNENTQQLDFSCTNKDQIKNQRPRLSRKTLPTIFRSKNRSGFLKEIQFYITNKIFKYLQKQTQYKLNSIKAIVK